MKNNIIKERSYCFAIRVVKLYKHLSHEKRAFVLSKQLLRSGTSIGANVEEAVGGISKADFRAKLSIAYKEARETIYGLRLLHDTNFIDDNSYHFIYQNAEESGKILFPIIQTTKK
ncbi:MAG: four helix bundle protein [Bacteroidetes bacterium]|nr:MAG: four helix bundle protein [Bacteroidota bacterium]